MAIQGGVVTLAHPCPAEITFAEMRESAAQTSAATIRSLWWAFVDFERATSGGIGKKV